jgi:branched-chain amino acid aminotransferase
MPKAKSLNMLPSYVYFSIAKKLGLDDCLFLEEDKILEGSRTNFFGIKGKTIYSASESKILNGITRETVLEIALKNGYSFKETSFRIDSLQDNFDNVFITSTSTKILPIKTIYLNHQNNRTTNHSLEKLESIEFTKISDSLKELIKLYDDFLHS